MSAPTHETILAAISRFIGSAADPFFDEKNGSSRSNGSLFLLAAFSNACIPKIAAIEGVIG
jgi:hypothetical protein